MQTRPHLVVPSFRNVTTIVIASLAIASTSCTGRTRSAAVWPPRSGLHMLVFENGTTEPVRLYLVDQSTQVLIGHVQPGHTAVLRLPAWATDVEGRELSLVAVPAGTHRELPTASGGPQGAIRSLPLPANSLTTVRWRLAGQRLVSLPLRRTPQ